MHLQGTDIASEGQIACKACEIILTTLRSGILFVASQLCENNFYVLEDDCPLRMCPTYPAIMILRSITAHLPTTHTHITHSIQVCSIALHLLIIIGCVWMDFPVAFGNSVKMFLHFPKMLIHFPNAMVF